MGFQVLLRAFLYLTFTWQFTISSKRSCQQTNKINHATLQIAGNVDIATAANRLGHTNTTTIGKIYIHAIQSAGQVLENLLKPLNKSKTG